MKRTISTIALSACLLLASMTALAGEIPGSTVGGEIPGSTANGEIPGSTVIQTGGTLVLVMWLDGSIIVVPLN